MKNEGRNKIKQAVEQQFPLVATGGAAGLNHEGNMPVATETSDVPTLNQ